MRHARSEALSGFSTHYKVSAEKQSDILQTSKSHKISVYQMSDINDTLGRHKDPKNAEEVMSKGLKTISLQITEYNVKNELSSGGGVLCKRDTSVDKKDIARRRWRILARALKSPISSQPSSPTDEISMRRFSTFMLLTTELLDDPTPQTNKSQNDDNTNILDKEKENGRRKAQLPYKKRAWFRYSACINGGNYFTDIGHVSRSFTAADLIGFNNTGNVCVWPSEEALAYYILNNLDLFRGKTVLELGAGMSALAGLMLAKYAAPNFVHLTDGNSLAVENIKASLEKNSFACPVSSSVLKWGAAPKCAVYDVILSADCLFFDEARLDLIETIWASMDEKSVALVMAPRRRDTLDLFSAHAQLRGFVCRKMAYYNHVVWQRHLACLENPDYDEDIHYPVLLYLTKTDSVLRQ